MVQAWCSTSREFYRGFTGTEFACCSVLAGLSLVFLGSFLKGSPWEIPTRNDLKVSGAVYNYPPSAQYLDAVGLTPIGYQLTDSSLSTEVGKAILNARAPSMRKRYDLKWHLFATWCAQRHIDKVHCQFSA